MLGGRAIHSPAPTRLRYAIGRAVRGIETSVLSAPWFPLTRYVPPGRSWLYDIQRFARSRSIATIFDVGANVGQTASALLRFYPKAQIHCFEPDARAYQELESRFGRRVRCHQVALGAVQGEALMRLYGDTELSTLTEGRPHAEEVGQTCVPVTTLDGFCRERDVDSVGILKMDVQGWEMEVLSGASGLLQSGGIRFIFAEVGFHRRDRDMQGFANLNDHLTKAGYEFCGLYEPFRWGPAKLYVGFANALYARPEATREQA